MTIKGKAYIAGIFEHPTRHAPDPGTVEDVPLWKVQSANEVFRETS
jgi:hypothetical protein